MRHTDECDYRKRHNEKFGDPDCWCEQRKKKKWQEENKD